MNKRIVIGIPIIGGVPGENFLSLVAAILETYKTLGLRGDIGYSQSVEAPRMHVETPLNKFPHDIPRAQIMNLAIKGDFDYVFFMDSDMVIPTLAFPELLKVMEEEKPAVVSGHYYRRGYPYTNVWSHNVGSGDQEQSFQVDADSGVHEISFSGLGCALIDVKWVRDNLEPPYFTMGIGKMHSEVQDDTSFFSKVREKGGRVLGHAGIRCGHLGGQLMICDQNVQQLRELFLGKQV